MRKLGRPRSAIGAVHELELTAITGPSWSARNSPDLTDLDDWFTAANLHSALARPGHELSYDRSGNGRVKDRFQSTAAIGRRPLEREHPPNQSVTVPRS